MGGGSRLTSLAVPLAMAGVAHWGRSPRRAAPLLPLSPAAAANQAPLPLLIANGNHRPAKPHDRGYPPSSQGGVRLASPAAPLAIAGVAHWGDVRAVPTPCSRFPPQRQPTRPPLPFLMANGNQMPAKPHGRRTIEKRERCIA
jgi:hypothetical protein